MSVSPAPYTPTRNETTVLTLLRAANAPMTAYQIIGRMQSTSGAVAPPTVYRALKGLEKAGLVRRIESLRAWAAATVIGSGVVTICDDCGGISTVDAPEVMESLHRKLVATGFSEENRIIEVHGLCEDCSGSRA